MRTKKKIRLCKEMKVLSEFEINVEKVKLSFLKDRYRLSLLCGYKLLKEGRIKDLERSLVVGLMGGNVLDEKSINLCLMEFKRKME